MNELQSRTGHLLNTDHGGRPRPGRTAYSVHRLPVSFSLHPNSQAARGIPTDSLPSTFMLSSITAQTTGLRSDRTIESEANILSGMTGTQVEGEIAVAFLSKNRGYGWEIWVHGPSTMSDHIEVLRFDHLRGVNPDRQGATSSTGRMRRSEGVGAENITAEALAQHYREAYIKRIREEHEDTELVTDSLTRHPEIADTFNGQEAVKSFREHGSFTALLHQGGCLSLLDETTGDGICSQLEREMLQLNNTYVYPFATGRSHLKAFSILSSPAWTEQGIFAVRLTNTRRDQNATGGYSGLMSYIYCPP